MDVIWVLSMILLAAGLSPAVTFLSRYLRLRGTRLVTCPETTRPAAVRIDAARAAGNAAWRAKRIELEHCTRWPERRSCGQECRCQVQLEGEHCLVRNIVGRWYAGRSCACCGRAFGCVSPLDHPPALRIPGSLPIQWSLLPAEDLPGLFDRSEPVCWDCLIAEHFRARHPELVTDRLREE